MSTCIHLTWCCCRVQTLWALVGSQQLVHNLLVGMPAGACDMPVTAGTLQDRGPSEGRETWQEGPHCGNLHLGGGLLGDLAHEVKLAVLGMQGDVVPR